MENVSASRRQILAAAAATVTLPMLSSALGSLRSAQANTPAPTTAAAASAPAAAGGWITTTLKPADLKDKEFTAVTGQPIIVTRSDKTVVAFTNKCTHKGCAITVKPAVSTLTCQCHGAQYSLDGAVTKAPATMPLVHFAIRVSDKGFIEIDPTQKPAKDDKTASVTIS